MSYPIEHTANRNTHKDVVPTRQDRNNHNNDGDGNTRNIPCNHAGLAWSTYPRPSLSPPSISLSLAQELDVLSQDGYGSNAYIPRQATTKPPLATTKALPSPLGPLPSHYQTTFGHDHATTKLPLATTKALPGALWPLPSPLWLLPSHYQASFGHCQATTNTPFATPKHP